MTLCRQSPGSRAGGKEIYMAAQKTTLQAPAALPGGFRLIGLAGKAEQSFLEKETAHAGA